MPHIYQTFKFIPSAIVAIFAFLTVPAFAQNSNADIEASDAKVRALIQAAPLLDVERTEIHLDPPLPISGLTALTGDAEGNLYLFQRNLDLDPIIVVDEHGKVLRSFGKGLYARPHGISLDPEGNVWAVDSNTSVVYRFTPEGEVLLRIDVGNVPDTDRASRGATNVKVSEEGLVYITDGYTNSRVLVYDLNGNKIREWGSHGMGPGEFRIPHAIAVGPDGNIYVADFQNGRVQIFTPEGEYLKEWHYGGRLDNLAFSPDGELFIGIEPTNAPNMVEAAIFHINREDGSVLGKIDDFGHQLNIGGDGAILPSGLREKVVVYRLK